MGNFVGDREVQILGRRIRIGSSGLGPGPGKGLRAGQSSSGPGLGDALKLLKEDLAGAVRVLRAPGASTI